MAFAAAISTVFKSNQTSSYIPFMNRAKDPHAPCPDSSPSDSGEGSGRSLSHDVCAGKLEETIVEQKKKKNVDFAKKVEQMPKHVEKIEQITTEEKEAVAAAIRSDPPKGKTYIQWNDVEKFMEYCVQPSHSSDREKCVAYFNAWKNCKDKYIRSKDN